MNNMTRQAGVRIVPYADADNVEGEHLGAVPRLLRLFVRFKIPANLGASAAQALFGLGDGHEVGCVCRTRIRVDRDLNLVALS
jgi:hypothetical protein